MRAPFLSAGLEEHRLIVSHGRHIRFSLACVLVVITTHRYVRVSVCAVSPTRTHLQFV